MLKKYTLPKFLYRNGFFLAVLTVLAVGVVYAPKASALTAYCKDGSDVSFSGPQTQEEACKSNGGAGNFNDVAKCRDGFAIPAGQQGASACKDHGGYLTTGSKSAAGAGGSSGGSTIPVECGVAKDSNGTPSTTACEIEKNDIVTHIINPAIKVFSVLVGVVAVIMFIVAGIIYSTAQDDPKRISMAKKMIVDVVIGIAAYIFLFAFLNYILPQGVK